MDGVRILEIGSDELSCYDMIPSHLLVESILRVEEADHGLGGFRMLEEPVKVPYTKNYDAPDEKPSDWAAKHDDSRWGFFVAAVGGSFLGGAAVTLGTTLLPMAMFQCPDLAVLWDLRVVAEERRRGVGSLLFRSAAGWARSNGCRQMALETQNINVPACRFYARQGCRLGAIHRHGYAGIPAVADEVMLLWYLDL